MSQEALYWIKTKNPQEVQCLLCPHNCVIPENSSGICRVRKNVKGKLYTINYGMITAVALDPIEKKPLKKFMPGSKVLSLGTFGCNLSCGYCQNWNIAHGEKPQAEYISSEQIVNKAKELVDSGNVGLAYTYSEPLMWYEYVLNTAKLAKKAGLKNILVTNGYINPKPLKELLPFIDAVNLDVKAFTNDFYQGICKGKLEPVLNSAKLFAANCHLEITTLLVTNLNDNQTEIKKLAHWIASLDKNIPLHLTRYFPNYKMDLPPTSLEKMRAAKEGAEEFLHNVLLGNV